jgi:hypothetical protein
MGVLRIKVMDIPRPLFYNHDKVLSIVNLCAKIDQERDGVKMKKLLSTLIALIFFASPSYAATPRQIADAYRADPSAALKEYGWEQMELSGTVTSCELAFNDCATIWAVRIEADGADVVGYTTRRVGTGAGVTLKGTCAGFRLAGERVTIVLDKAEAK